MNYYGRLQSDGNIIESVSVNGVGVEVSDKNVDIKVPTKVSELDNDSMYASKSEIPTKVSELDNDSMYVTDDELTLNDYASKTYVSEQISKTDHLKRDIVTSLPEASSADEYTIYMLKDDTATGEDVYKEYMLIDGALKCVGDTSVDLSGYAKSDTLKAHTENTDVHVSTTEKEQWNSADANVIESISVNGVVVEPSNKNVNINLSDYVETYTAEWKGLTFNFYKQGRLINMQISGNLKEDISTANKYVNVMPIPPKFRPREWVEFGIQAVGYSNAIWLFMIKISDNVTTVGTRNIVALGYSLFKTQADNAFSNKPLGSKLDFRCSVTYISES